MPKKEQFNLARVVYEAYPHSDLLPIDPIQDCQSLDALKSCVASDNIGDSLFRFLIVEISEGGAGSLDGAIRVVQQARNDVEAVLGALVRRRDARARRKVSPVTKTPPGEDPSAPRVIITVSGGVADVLCKPRGIAVTVLDYDVEGSDEHAGRVSRDPDGQLCAMGQWSATDLVLGNRHWPQVRQSRHNAAALASWRWICPECQRTVRLNYEELAAAGAPYCPNCDLEMTLV